MTLAQEKIAVVGATGAVGREMLRLLETAGVPAEHVRAYSSIRSTGNTIAYGRGQVVTRPLDDRAPGWATVAFFAASADVARAAAPAFVESGAIVVDNSSAFRMAPDVALVVPEVNGIEVAGDRTPRIIANPNCSTIILLVAATPLHRAFGCRRIIVSTYQAASGAGIEAMNELETQTRDVLDGEKPQPVVFPEPCAFNVFSHDSAVDVATGANVEETKMIEETVKIWCAPHVAVIPTCIRVPAMRSHCESIHLTLAAPATEAAVREALARAPGVELLDDRAGGRFPTSLAAANRHEVLVGRVRPDRTTALGDAYEAFSMFVAGDQLLKGAALNAVQIAQLAVAQG